MNAEVDLLTDIARTELAETIPELADGVAVYSEYRNRLLDQWDMTGEQLAEDSRFFVKYRDYILADPIVVDGRELTANAGEARALLEFLDDQIVIACTTPPTDWGPLESDPDMALPELTVVAAAFETHDWSTIDLAAGQVTLVLSGYRAMARSPDGATLVAPLAGDSSLLLIDPTTWSATQIEAAGPGWACPSLTVDGTEVVGDLFDVDTGDRTTVLFDLNDTDRPLEIDGIDGACPISIGQNEFVHTTGDRLVATDVSSGTGRELMVMPFCNLVPIARPVDGLLDVYANCRNPYHDGLWQVEVDTGLQTHLIAGRVGAGDLSIDGRWRIMGYGSHDQSPLDVRPWLVDSETGQSTKVTDEFFVFPVFVADGLR